MNQKTARQYHLTVTAPETHQSPVALLAQASGLSHQAIKDAMHKGAVWLTRGGHTRHLRRHKAKLQPDDELHLNYSAVVLGQTVTPATLIADEGDFSIWDKPPGMLSQGSKWGDHTTITRFAEVQLQRVSFLIHRLDRAASGLMVVAHGKQTARELTALFEQRKVEKIYQVRVAGEFPQQIQHYKAPLDARPALTHAKRIDYDPYRDSSLLEVQIDTGRKHQIRLHLAAAGHPVLGDRLYGPATKTDMTLQLRSTVLSFKLKKLYSYRVEGLSNT